MIRRGRDRLTGIAEVDVTYLGAERLDKRERGAEGKGLVVIAALLKRWLMGTHQGAVSHDHLDYYPDEYTFRFNRRTSRYRGKLFHRLIQQAVAIDPVRYSDLVTHTWGLKLKHNI